GGRELEGGRNSPSPYSSPFKGEEVMRNYAEDYISISHSNWDNVAWRGGKN
ncbi:unnamed protein product, partial [marine sediment metagenome]